MMLHEHIIMNAVICITGGVFGMSFNIHVSTGSEYTKDSVPYYIIHCQLSEEKGLVGHGGNLCNKVHVCQCTSPQ